MLTDQRTRSVSSARAVLPLLLDLTEARSLVDVGCGTGEWLATAGDLGVDTVVGLDGAWVEGSTLAIPPAAFRVADLGQPLRLDRTFDLALCLEVAEHLPPERAASFVTDLTALSPQVAFSAAIPGQDGVGHENEQWADYWHDLFRAEGFVPLDVIRQAVWDNPRVAAWYAQNTFLYVAQDRVTPQMQLRAGDLPIRVVHPELFEWHRSRPRPPSGLRAALKATVRHRLRRSPGAR